jgi:hypothetical protein
MDPIIFIKETARAIQERKVKPSVIIENPHKILSGETKKIVINKRGLGIKVGESIVDVIIKYGSTIKKDELEWETFCNIPDDNMKSTYIPRDDPVLVKVIERVRNAFQGKTIPDPPRTDQERLAKDLQGFKIAEVPVEEWAWYIGKAGEHTKLEYVAMRF